MTRKEFRKVKRTLPEYNNGRKVIPLLYGTKAAQTIIDRTQSYVGYFLSDAYVNPSLDKQIAFQECCEMFAHDAGSYKFRVNSRNSYCFTVSWLTDEHLIYLTAKKEYIVFF